MPDTESVLPIREDWNGNRCPASAMEIHRAEATASRIRREVAEIRRAAKHLAEGSPFEVAVSDFLTVQATMLERAGATTQRADNLSDLDDTRDQPGIFTTPARNALLIARAHTATSPLTYED